MDEVPRSALLITPHPDDAEGGCGGTLAGWIRRGTTGVYVLCTNGDKGTSDPEMQPERLAAIREQEQKDAALVLGVSEVVFLRHPDGTLEDSREFRRELVREVRRHRPEVVMCIDPYRSTSHTHRDHRISGQVALDAIYPYAWGRHYFPELLLDEGLQPHRVEEVYLWGSEEPDSYVDISDTLELKFESLKRHASQFSDLQGRWQRLVEGAQRVGERGGLPYAEAFRRLRLSPDPLVNGYLV